MARTYHAIVHFELEEDFVTHSKLSGSEYTSVVADSEEHATELMEVRMGEMDGHSWEFV